MSRLRPLMLVGVLLGFAAAARADIPPGPWPRPAPQPDPGSEPLPRPSPEPAQPPRPATGPCGTGVALTLAGIASAWGVWWARRRLSLPKPMTA